MEGWGSEFLGPYLGAEGDRAIEPSGHPKRLFVFSWSIDMNDFLVDVSVFVVEF